MTITEEPQKRMNGRNYIQSNREGLEFYLWMEYMDVTYCHIHDLAEQPRAMSKQT